MKMSENKAASVAIQIVDLLTPLQSDERQRAVKAALTLLGEANIKSAISDSEQSEPDSDNSLNQRTKIWMKQNGLKAEALEHVFHFHESEVELIVHDVPGNTASAQVKNVYILCGILRLLSEGIPTFDDSLAREICTQSGCYDHTNHSKRIKDFGNLLAGDKNKGWTLTTPGLKAGADLIKEILSKKEQI